MRVISYSSKSPSYIFPFPFHWQFLQSLTYYSISFPFLHTSQPIFISPLSSAFLTSLSLAALSQENLNELCSGLQNWAESHDSGATASINLVLVAATTTSASFFPSHPTSQLTFSSPYAFSFHSCLTPDKKLCSSQGSWVVANAMLGKAVLTCMVATTIWVKISCVASELLGLT